MSIYKKYHKSKRRAKIKFNSDNCLLEAGKSTTKDYNQQEQQEEVQQEQPNVSAMLVNNTGKKEIFETKVFNECKSELIKIIGKTGFFYVNVPVILSEQVIYINLENTIKLYKPATAIKSIKRKVVINKYNVIPEAKRLFLSGEVIKSIEYSEEICSSIETVQGHVKNVTVEIPFDCVTKVGFIAEPKVSSNEHNGKIYKNEEGEEIYTDFYNDTERIYCQLVHVSFEEINIKEDEQTHSELYNIKTFSKIVQKMSMNLTIRLIQNQVVNILN